MTEVDKGPLQQRDAARGPLQAGNWTRCPCNKGTEGPARTKAEGPCKERSGQKAPVRSEVNIGPLQEGRRTEDPFKEGCGQRTLQ